MRQVILYTKHKCSLCEEAEALLSLFSNEYPYHLIKRDIYTNDSWLEEFQLQIPVIEINGKQLNCEEINYKSVEMLFSAEQEGELNQ
ncbi:glutaredoxin family protein [Oceanobacillus saliphilus]|uniref:glutaredoxin family protein n=1 Tax=Oceanobacillus saliphilus TaxID=2925834 RepID=UPI00201E2BA9|nr:glutaredoxin family protein [Oceanobacillus saliphilus]